MRECRSYTQRLRWPQKIERLAGLIDILEEMFLQFHKMREHSSAVLAVTLSEEIAPTGASCDCRPREELGDRCAQGAISHPLRVTNALMPMASKISCSRAIAKVWYSVSSYRLMTCLLTPSLRASSVWDTPFAIRIFAINGAI